MLYFIILHLYINSQYIRKQICYDTLKNFFIQESGFKSGFFVPQKNNLRKFEKNCKKRLTNLKASAII